LAKGMVEEIADDDVEEIDSQDVEEDETLLEEGFILECTVDYVIVLPSIMKFYWGRIIAIRYCSFCVSFSDIPNDIKSLGNDKDSDKISDNTSDKANYSREGVEVSASKFHGGEKGEAVAAAVEDDKEEIPTSDGLNFRENKIDIFEFLCKVSSNCREANHKKDD